MLSGRVALKMSVAPIRHEACEMSSILGCEQHVVVVAHHAQTVELHLVHLQSSRDDSDHQLIES